jgi:hypothetical protein
VDVRNVSGKGGWSFDGGVRGVRQARRYGSEDWARASPMGTLDPLLKVMRISERCFEDMAMTALEEEILGVAAGCAGVVKAHGKSF